MPIPEKYGHISFTPPPGAVREAEKAVEWRTEHCRGGTAGGIVVARSMAGKSELSPSVVRRMKAYFDRNEDHTRTAGFTLGDEKYPSNERISWAAWGGDTGRAWANKIVAQMDAADANQSTETRSAPMQEVERRYLAYDSASQGDSIKLESRADPLSGKVSTHLIGYAAKFGATSLLLGDFYERIAPTAFEIVEMKKDLDGFPLETRGLFNHDPNELLGRFPTTMTLTVDDIGLRYDIKLPESRSDIAELVSRGDLKGSSFSFVCAEGGERWSIENGKSIRTVTKIKTLLDAGPVTYPAYRDSSVAVARRSYEHHMQTVSKLSEAKAKAAAMSAKMREFVEGRAMGNATNSGGGAVSGGGDCGRDGGGKFGGGNHCQAEGDGKYMEWKKGDHKEAGKTDKAQGFIDKARKDQTVSAGKSGGKSDDGGGVQTWSKGDHFPWVVSQVGHDNGHLQAVHPDGTRTEKYPFSNGDSTEAMKKIQAEIESKKKSKRSFDTSETVHGIITFLRNRRK
jgi:uncharacterized protein